MDIQPGLYNVYTKNFLWDKRIANRNVKYFENRSFMQFQAQDFSIHVLLSTLEEEEVHLKKIVRTVSMNEVPTNVVLVGSRILYKVKIRDDKPHRLNARIAPHGNENLMRNELWFVCASYPQFRLRILLSVAALNWWRLKAFDDTASFVQTGLDARDVYVVSPQENFDQGCVFWLQVCVDDAVVAAVDSRFKLGKVNSAPKVLQVFDLNTAHDKNFLLLSI